MKCEKTIFNWGNSHRPQQKDISFIWMLVCCGIEIKTMLGMNGILYLKHLVVQ